MSLMSKLLVTILALSSFLFADEDKVVEFLQKGIGANPNIKSLTIKVISKKPLVKPKGWQAYIIQLNGKAKGRDGKDQEVSQRSIYFVSDDGIITTELHDLNTGKKLSSSISPEFDTKYYDEAHHLFGNKDAAHKVVIFSDPLCPFCRTFVPEALSFMKKYPKTYVVYYFHFPLQNLHPAAVTLVHAAAAAELQGRKNIVSGLYNVKIGGRELNQQKILDAFNKAQNTKISLLDLDNKAVKEHIVHDMKVAQEHLVNGTPTMFLDGKKDNSKLLYKKVKLIK